MKISVSYLTSYYSKEKTIELIEHTTCDYIHVDLMDGGFVPVKNFDLQEVITLLKEHQKPLDIHLMTFDPILYIPDLISINPEIITFHIEATKDIVKTIEYLKHNQIKVGLAIKPNTDLLELVPYLSFIDYVLVMSVEPGKGGQAFLNESTNRVKELLKIREENHLNFKISIDGGINQETIKQVKEVDMAVVGSYICKSNYYQKQINNLK